MLQLKDVSTYYSSAYFYEYVRKCIDVDEIIDRLIEAGIIDYQMLKEYIDVCSDEEYRNNLIEMLQNVESIIKLKNHRDKKFVIYEIPKQENIRLVKNDQLNKCSCLILGNPMIPRGTAYLELNKYSVELAKHAISHVDLSGKNTLINISKIGGSHLPKIYSALQFYDEQVLRQLNEKNSDNVDNLFEFNKDKKKEIVLEQYDDIVEYLLNTANACVWGELTPRQKILMQETKIIRGYNSLRRKNNLVDIITNYTTLSELEEGIVKTKTLDRFIVK